MDETHVAHSLVEWLLVLAGSFRFCYVADGYVSVCCKNVNAFLNNDNWCNCYYHLNDIFEFVVNQNDDSASAVLAARFIVTSSQNHFNAVVDRMSFEIVWVSTKVMKIFI